MILDILSFLMTIFFLWKWQVTKSELVIKETELEHSKFFTSCYIQKIFKVGYITGGVFEKEKVYCKDLKDWEYSIREDGKLVLTDKCGHGLGVFDILVD